MNEEMMTNEELMTVEGNEEENETRSGMPTGLAMLIGSGITLAVIAGGKKLKKMWDKRKAEKEVQVVAVEPDEVEVQEVE